jgi:hypothetical protein
MFSTVFEKDPMDKAAGDRYRRRILEVGGSRCVCFPFPFFRSPHLFLPFRNARSDEMDSLVDFLGRKPNNEAFLKSLLG